MKKILLAALACMILAAGCQPDTENSQPSEIQPESELSEEISDPVQEPSAEESSADEFSAESSVPEESGKETPPFLDITDTVCTWDREPVLLRFLDNDTLAVECMLDTNDSVMLYHISEDQAEESEDPLDAARPNSFDRQVVLAQGGKVFVSEDLAQVTHVSDTGTETLLLDGSTLNPTETFWILTAKGRWGAVSSNTMDYVPSCWVLDLQENTASRLEISGEVIPSDIEGDMLLFVRENVLTPSADHFLHVYHADTGEMTAIDAQTDLGAAKAVFSTGGNFVLSCQNQDTEAQTLTLAVYETASGQLTQTISLDGYSVLGDTAFQPMALSPDGTVLAVLARETPEDTETRLLLYHITP